MVNSKLQDIWKLMNALLYWELPKRIVKPKLVFSYRKKEAGRAPGSVKYGTKVADTSPID